MCAGHCPAERWRTRLRSNTCRAVTVITASRYDSSRQKPWLCDRQDSNLFCRPLVWQAELTFIPNGWYQEFELLISTMRNVDVNNSNSWYQQFGINVNSACHTLVTRRLMLSMTLWTLIVCAGVLSRPLSFWLAYSFWFFWVFRGDHCEYFLPVNKIVLTSLYEYFSATVSNGWVLYDSSFHSAPCSMSVCEHKHFAKVWQRCTLNVWLGHLVIAAVTAVSVRERILKIGQHLLKSEAKNIVTPFFPATM